MRFPLSISIATTTTNFSPSWRSLQRSGIFSVDYAENIISNCIPTYTNRNIFTMFFIHEQQTNGNAIPTFNLLHYIIIYSSFAHEGAHLEMVISIIIDIWRRLVYPGLHACEGGKIHFPQQYLVWNAFIYNNEIMHAMRRSHKIQRIKFLCGER